MLKKEILIMLSLVFFLTGCWDKRELNEIAITVGLGIDKGENGYIVSAQVIVPSELSSKGGAGHSQIVVYRATGETLDSTIRSLTKQSPRRFYPGHLQMVVLSESIAEEGIGKPLDLLSRNWDVRADFYMVVAKDNTPEEILNVQTPLESIPSTNMFYTLQGSEKSNANTTGVKLDKLIRSLETQGLEPVLTGIQIKGDEKNSSSKQNVESIIPAAHFQYDGLAIFKEDKLIGWLDEHETRGYNAIMNNVKRAVSSVACPEEGKLTIDVEKFQTKKKAKIVNSTPEINLDINILGNVGSVECKIDLTKEESIKEIEKIYEKQVIENIHQTIKTVQGQYNSDIFGFGATIYQHKPKEWKKLKNNWEEEFPKVKVNVNVTAKINHLGAVNNSFTENMKD